MKSNGTIAKLFLWKGNRTEGFIPVQTVDDLYNSIPRMPEAVLNANAAPFPY